MATRLVSVVIDAADPAATGRWWSDALGWPIVFENDDEVALAAPAGGEPGASTAVEIVVGLGDDPKVVKNRVHLDLASDSSEHQRNIVDRLVAAGAVPVDIGQHDVPWVVLTDPFGNELCVLEPRDLYVGRGPLASIVLDAADPNALAPFWVAATGWPIGASGEGFVSLRNPDGSLPDLDLVRDQTARSVKNRVHLDVAPFPGGSSDAEADRLVSLGARRIDIGQRDVTWIVLADPEGNELCVLSPR
jgi:catechol 2,3-dioxygenase-like lactoylglutathione lyase family enzyme